MPGRRARAPRILFGQMREDADVELALLRNLPRPEQARVFCVASAGCTLLTLLTGGAAHITAVDVNPAQLELVRLKLAMAEHLQWKEFYEAITTDANAAYEKVRSTLTSQTQAFWDTQNRCLTRGLAQCGLADRNLQRAATMFRILCKSRADCLQFLMQDDVQAQNIQMHKWRRKIIWRTGFDCLLNRRALRLAFGGKISARFPSGFPSLMRERLERAMVTNPVRRNPYLWQLFLQQFPPDEAGWPRWLRRDNFELIRERASRLTLKQAEVYQLLSARPNETYDIIALSNVVELSSRLQTETLLAAAAQSVSAGGSIVLRYILPADLNWIKEAKLGIRIDREASAQARAIERGPFCTEIFVLKKC